MCAEHEERNADDDERQPKTTSDFATVDVEIAIRGEH
jgi:hypothetical protein